MDFGKVFSRSWDLIWKNKVLWIFGILASCGSRSGGSGGGGFNSSSNFQTGSGDFGNLPPQMERFARQMQMFFERIPQERIVLYGLIFAAVILIIVLITWLIGIYGKVGLIKGVLQADAGKPITFGQLWSDAFAIYGRALGLNSILSLVPFFLLIFLGILAVVFVAGTAGIGFLCLLPIVCVLVPVFIAYSVYTEIANVALIREELGALNAIKRGWEVFRSNLGNLALMALILGFGSFVVSFIVALPFIIAALPFVFSMMSGGEQAFTQSLWIYGICLVVGIPLFLVFNGILQSYLQSAWTLTYGELTGAKKPAVKRVAARTKK